MRHVPPLSLSIGLPRKEVLHRVIEHRIHTIVRLLYFLKNEDTEQVRHRVNTRSRGLINSLRSG